MTTSAEDQEAVRRLREETGGRAVRRRRSLTRQIAPEPPGGPPPADAAASGALGEVPAVQLDYGTFKYVLIWAGVGAAERLFVRGQAGAPYHVDVARSTVQLLQGMGCLVEVLGGGRIRHDPERRQVEVFGFSYGFGRADHGCTQGLIMGDPSYAGYEVVVTDEAY